MVSINKKMAKGAAWMVTLKIVERSLGLISTVILARLLIPNDFGLIAMAMSIFAIIELMSAFGFDTALIQNQDARRTHYDTAWTLNVLFGLFSALVLASLAAPAAGFYNEPRLINIIYLLAIGAFIQGFENIGTVFFRKEMEFNKEFKFIISKKIIAFCVTVPLAIILKSYWALVIGMLAFRVSGVFFSYAFHPYRPKFSLAEWRQLFNFSKWLLITNLLNFLRIRSANFTIGRFSGANALGLYSIAQEISELPTTEMVMLINRGIFPGYAKLSKDINDLRDGFLNVISVIYLIALPAGAGVAATAELFVPVLLGNKWLDTIPLIQILAFYGVTISVQINSPLVYYALNKPKISTYIAALYIMVLLPLLIWLTSIASAIGAAWAYLITALVFLPINYSILFIHLQLVSTDFIAKIWRPVFASIFMYLVVNYYTQSTQYLITHIGYAVQMMLAILLGIITYIVILLGLWILSHKPDGAEKIVLHKFIPIIKSKFKISKS